MPRHLTFDDALDRYLADHAAREVPTQRALREATRSLPGAGMQIGADEGALLALLVRLIGARQTIEIGVYTGYSTLAVALALPDDGRILACDIRRDTTDVGRRHWADAGVAHKVDLRIAPALQTLDAELAAGGADRYDFAFIDADKTGYDTYVERCLRLVRSGGLLAIDNTLWGGAVARPAAPDDADTRALQALNDKLHVDPRVDVALLTVGDGLTLARRR